MREDNLLQYQFESCILGGAIGDAWGSSFENQQVPDHSTTFFLGQQKEPDRQWAFTDDTQLTMATCEALCLPGPFDPAALATNFVRYYRERKLTGIGASTLKAIIELQAGAHWSQVARSGEFAAGNGAAMRIAPFAFFKNISRENIRDACRITHKNEEAYVGALAIILCIKAILSGHWIGENNLFDLIIPELPDTRLRDRLIAINSFPKDTDISTIAKLGNNGYVVNSVPLAIFAATQIHQLGLTGMFQALIDAGGDTDTNASLAGQIAGTLLGVNNFPDELMQKLQATNHYNGLQKMIETVKRHMN
jgi:ADP-ribosyl-[dinitrogen reductase] hydrolase